MKLKEKERIDDLEYKGLKVIQQEDGFCFGIDSVLLSDFAKDIKKEAVGLDLGTGTGILGILLCGKTELSKIYGIEIQEQVAEMAKRSIQLNGLESRFEIINKEHQKHMFSGILFLFRRWKQMIFCIVVDHGLC